MISRVIKTVAALTAVVCASVSWAGEPAEQAIVDQLRSTLELPATGLKLASVETSELPGLYAVQLVNGPLIYATARGDYFISGDLFSVGPTGYVNLGEKRRDVGRAAQLAEVDIDDMIVFSPEGEVKAAVTVFTDVSCFYCQKLHQEVPELNRQGVEVRYLAYPRAGIGSEAYTQLASAWCAKDPQTTMTMLKNRESVVTNVCPGNPVAAQYALGQEMGVRGTPAIVTESGKMIPGYQSAADLMVTLGLK